MKAHLTERAVKGLQPKQNNIIIYDEEVVGFGVRIQQPAHLAERQRQLPALQRRGLVEPSGLGLDQRQEMAGVTDHVACFVGPGVAGDLNATLPQTGRS